MENEKWFGIPREEIDWFPKIDEEKCINCMVACQTCSNLCPAGAIAFANENDTPRAKAQRIVKDFKLIPKAKEDLEKRKEDLKL